MVGIGKEKYLFFKFMLALIETLTNMYFALSVGQNFDQHGLNDVKIQKVLFCAHEYKHARVNGNASKFCFARTNTNTPRKMEMHLCYKEVRASTQCLLQQQKSLVRILGEVATRAAFVDFRGIGDSLECRSREGLYASSVGSG